MVRDRSKRSNWLTEAKYNLVERRYGGGTEANRFIKQQARRCERRAAKQDVEMELLDALDSTLFEEQLLC